jgi:predicted RNA-binding Zn ribbon-like protein
VIDDALLAKINQHCDVVLSSSSAAAVPSLCWGMAGRLLDDRRTVEAWVREDQARQFLADVRATGRVAAVFSEPYTNVAVQLKGRGGSVRAATRDDEAFLRQHVAQMVRELARVNFNEAFARNFFEHPWTLLAVVRFEAAEIFVQTPGPRAGQPLNAAPEAGHAA